METYKIENPVKHRIIHSFEFEDSYYAIAYIIGVDIDNKTTYNDMYLKFIEAIDIYICDNKEFEKDTGCMIINESVYKHFRELNEKFKGVHSLVDPDCDGNKMYIMYI